MQPLCRFFIISAYLFSAPMVPLLSNFGHWGIMQSTTSVRRVRIAVLNAKYSPDGCWWILSDIYRFVYGPGQVIVA